MPKYADESRRFAIDLVDVIEDSWDQKRRWMTSALQFDPGLMPRSRAWVEEAVGRLEGRDGHDYYEAMSTSINTPDSLMRRKPVRGAVRGLRRVQEEGELFLISGRCEEKRAVTRAWLAANGLGWIPKENLVLLGFRSARLTGIPAPAKLSWCARAGADVLVDNQSAQLHRGASEAQRVGRVLFSADPEEIAARPRGVAVARTWAELVRLLRRRTALA